MTKLFSIFAATLMLTLSVAAFQPSHAATATFTQTERSYTQSPH
jgi:hypothetical protein